MRNRFAGPCYRCGKRVDVGAGHFERFGGRWRVQHATCAIKHRDQPDPLRAQYQRARDERLAQSTGKAAQNARRRIRDREKAESLARMRGNDMAMTRLDYQNAAAETLALAREIGLDAHPETDTPDGDFPHLADMTERMMRNDDMSLEKLGRWLGWMQGCVYVKADGTASLDDFKAINMRNSDNARKGDALAVAVPVDERDAFETAYAAKAGATAAKIRAHRGKHGGYSLTSIAQAFLGWKLAQAANVDATQEAFNDGHACGASYQKAMVGGAA